MCNISALRVCCTLWTRKQTIHELQAARRHLESDRSQLVYIPSSTRFGRSFVYVRTSSCLVVAILISDYQKLLIRGEQGIFAVAKEWRCTWPFKVTLLSAPVSRELPFCKTTPPRQQLISPMLFAYRKVAKRTLFYMVFALERYMNRSSFPLQ